MSDTTDLLQKLLVAVSAIQHDHKALAAAVDAIGGRVNALADVKQLRDQARPVGSAAAAAAAAAATAVPPLSPTMDEQRPPSEVTAPGSPVQKKPATAGTSRIILTTYPGQSGIDPIIMNWGEKDPAKRGPVVVARGSRTIRRRNGSSFLSFLFFYLKNFHALLRAVYVGPAQHGTSAEHIIQQLAPMAVLTASTTPSPSPSTN